MRCYACDEYFVPNDDSLDGDYCSKCSLIIVNSIEENNNESNEKGNINS